MATDIYLDWATGADTNTGTSSGSPKKHFNEPGGGDHGGLYLMPNPITDVVTFHIAGSVASAANYHYIDAIDTMIDLSNVVFSGTGARIVFEFKDWDNADYIALSPPDGGASWTVNGTKPATIPCVVGGRGRIEIVGIGVDGQQYYPGVVVPDGGEVSLVYAKVSNARIGVYARRANVQIENSYITDVDEGVRAESSEVTLIGNPLIHESRRCGVRARVRTSVMFSAWGEQPSSKFTATISTISPRGTYAAIAAESDSMIVLAGEVYEPMDVEPKAVAAELRILNASLVPSPGYVGVALLGGSKIIGANQVRFADPALYDGKETVPAGRQIVHSSKQGTLVID